MVSEPNLACHEHFVASVMLLFDEQNEINTYSSSVNHKSHACMLGILCLYNIIIYAAHLVTLKTRMHLLNAKCI